MFFNAQTNGLSLTNIEDSTGLENCVGRRFNDQWSGSMRTWIPAAKR